MEAQHSTHLMKFIFFGRICIYQNGYLVLKHFMLFHVIIIFCCVCCNIAFKYKPHIDFCKNKIIKITSLRCTFEDPFIAFHLWNTDANLKTYWFQFTIIDSHWQFAHAKIINNFQLLFYYENNTLLFITYNIFLTKLYNTFSQWLLE